jgi:hypothetical protein
MKINLRGLILNLAKNNKEISGSSFIPGRLRAIEKEMLAQSIDAAGIMKKLRSEEKFRNAFTENDWKVIESGVKKMIK